MYEKLASFYDSLVYDVDYKKISEYITEIISKNMTGCQKILDAGCGTGSFLVEMAKAGYEISGFDISDDMVAAANKKLLQNGFSNSVFQADMTDFKTFDKFDAIVSLLDSINYITSEDRLTKAFKGIYNALATEGVFIFDINTPYKFNNVLKDQFFYEIGEDICYLWNSVYNTKALELCHELTFFIKESNNLYKRYEERHIQKIYEPLKIIDLLKDTGFDKIFFYDDLTFRRPKEKALRIYFVCKKT